MGTVIFNSSASSSPIYMQLCDYFKKCLLLGEMRPGDKIPSVRDLAIELGVNPNTMQRALSSLESEGLFFSERTYGRFVTRDAHAIEDLKDRYIRSIVQTYFNSMKEIGIDNERAREMLREDSPKDGDE